MTCEVKLVGMTSPSAITGCNTAEDLIAYAARVSNPANQNNTKTSGKLLKYLIKENHWSPFEMVSVTMEITTTRDISRQILRHRSFSFQEFSQRYAEATEYEIPDLRSQDLKNRQNSIDDIPESAVEFYEEVIQHHMDSAMDIYHSLIEYGVAKECARAVLPLNTSTRLYMSGTIRSWLHYCDLRCSNGTQREHQLIADSIKELLFSEIPSIACAMWPPNLVPLV